MDNDFEDENINSRDALFQKMPFYDQINSALKEVYSEFLGIILFKIQLPSLDQWTSLDKEIRESFFNFRREAVEPLLSSYKIMGPVLLEKLAKELVGMWSNGINPQMPSWQLQETRLFILKSISEQLLAESNHQVEMYLTELFNVALVVNGGIMFQFLNSQDFPKVFKFSIINILGTFPDFFLKSQDFVFGALKCFNLVLFNKSLSVVTVRNFKFFCDSCSMLLTPYISDLGSIALELIKTDIIDSKDSLKLFSSINTVISNIDVPKKLEYSNYILPFVLDLISQQPQYRTEDNSKLEDYLNYVSDLMSVFHSDEIKVSQALAGNNDISTDFIENLKLFKQDTILQNSKSVLFNTIIGILSTDLIKEEEIYTPIFGIINKTITPEPHPFGLGVDEICSIYILFFDKSLLFSTDNTLFALSRVFNSFSQLALVYGPGRLSWQNEQEFKPEQMVVKIAHYANQLLVSTIKIRNLCSENPSIGSIDQTPIFPEKIFSFLNAFLSLKHDPLPCLNPELLDYYVSWSFSYFDGIDRIALMAVSKFLISLINCVVKGVSNNENQNTEISNNLSSFYNGITQRIFPNLFKALIKSAIFNTPRSQLETVSSIAMVFIKNNPDMSRTLLNEVFFGPDYALYSSLPDDKKKQLITQLLG
ncbi:hypothetical protein BB560_005766 [Smittium megazygosporum]|uniref:Uncharacterized protein n=1 Tax=Smittium megazygosporum TaxID=133381 RepID=A0A2T9YXK9_9FUNG|nr:hypothetical protein BB560_005766 [Smittium megazygosporum]